MPIYNDGDHLYCWLTENNLPYTHHGLYVGNGNVIEKSRNGVKLSSLHEFSEGSDIYIEEHWLRPFTREESCNRAYSQLKDNDYNIVFDNCEAFVSWCINGVSISAQVSTVAALAAMAHPVTRVAGIAVSATVGSNFISTKLPKEIVRTISENKITQNEFTKTTAENPVTTTIGGAVATVATGIVLVDFITLTAPVAVGIGILGGAAMAGGYLASKIKNLIND